MHLYCQDKLLILELMEQNVINEIAMLHKRLLLLLLLLLHIYLPVTGKCQMLTTEMICSLFIAISTLHLEESI